MLPAAGIWVAFGLLGSRKRNNAWRPPGLPWRACEGRRAMNKTVLLVGLIVGGASCGSAAPAAKWTPDSALLKQLAPATPAGAYKIQPPAAYKAATKPGPGGFPAYIWA